MSARTAALMLAIIAAPDPGPGWFCTAEGTASAWLSAARLGEVDHVAAETARMRSDRRGPRRPGRPARTAETRPAAGRTPGGLTSGCGLGPGRASPVRLGRVR